VVATYARMDVSDELATMGMGMHHCRTPDAVRLYSSPSIVVNDLAILAMRLSSDRSRGSSPRSIQARYLARQSSARGRFCLHGLSFVHVVTLEQGEHERLVRGVLVHGFRARWIRGSPRGFLLVRGWRPEVDDGFATSCAKTFGGMVIRPNAIFASSYASSLYLRGT
jgi:hypothetical protein